MKTILELEHLKEVLIEKQDLVVVVHWHHITTCVKKIKQLTTVMFTLKMVNR